MLTKFLLLEVALILVMIGTFTHQQLPETALRVGEKEIVIKEHSEKVAVPLPSELSDGRLVFPVEHHGTEAIISTFGDRRGSKRTHQGIDIKAPAGTPVVAVADGFVERIREAGNGGRQLYLRDAKGRLFYYAHLQNWAVEEFDAVRAGDVLGSVGATGNARGTTPHLHFEVLIGREKRAVDPMTYWVGA